MPLIQIVIVLIVVGVLLWLVNAYIPMDAKIKNILNIVVVIAVVLYLAAAGLRVFLDSDKSKAFEWATWHAANTYALICTGKPALALNV